jgi:hypothetical protein
MAHTHSRAGFAGDGAATRGGGFPTSRTSAVRFMRFCARLRLHLPWKGSALGKWQGDTSWRWISSFASLVPGSRRRVRRWRAARECNHAPLISQRCLRLLRSRGLYLAHFGRTSRKQEAGVVCGFCGALQIRCSCDSFAGPCAASTRPIWGPVLRTYGPSGCGR